jgi:hypothetical protein
MGIFDSFFHPENSYKDAQEQLQKFFQQAMGYQQPYDEAGKNQIGKLNTAEDRLLHPDELLNEWTSGYETSPFAKQLLGQSKAAGLDAASSMGLNGSSAALGNIQNSAGNIVNSDRNSYLTDLMEKYMKGIGIGQNIFNTGATTAGHEADETLAHGDEMAKAKFGEDSAPGEIFGKLFGGLGQLGANYLGGGFGTGGLGRGVWSPDFLNKTKGTWGMSGGAA